MWIPSTDLMIYRQATIVITLSSRGVMGLVFVGLLEPLRWEGLQFSSNITPFSIDYNRAQVLPLTLRDGEFFVVKTISLVIYTLMNYLCKRVLEGKAASGKYQ